MAPEGKSLLRVDNLKITFLVDNSIEWLTKFPPGFSSELSQHLTKHSPPVDKLTGVPFVDLENYCCGAHGFSARIETQVGESEPHTILFDTGPDSRTLIRNIKSMQVDTTKIERVVLSHWHGDHSGGLLSFLMHRNGFEDNLVTPEDSSSASSSKDGARTTQRTITVDLHPNRPIARGIAPPPGDKVIARLPEEPTLSEIESLGARVELSAEPHVVAGGTVYVSGEIPLVTEFEQGLTGGMRWKSDNTNSEEGSWTSEPHIMDERYAAIDVLGKGLVVFSACSHAGIVNVITDAVKTFQRPIYMIIGGLHLGGPELSSRIQPTIDFLSNRLRPSPTYVLPMHCSGFAAKVALERALGEGCVPAGVGVTVVVKGDEEMDGRLFAPDIV